MQEIELRECQAFSDSHDAVLLCDTFWCPIGSQCFDMFCLSWFDFAL